jgi:hypothetical protein
MLRTILSIETGTHNTAKQFQKSEKQSDALVLWSFPLVDGHMPSLVSFSSSNRPGSSLPLPLLLLFTEDEIGLMKCELMVQTIQLCLSQHFSQAIDDVRLTHVSGESEYWSSQCNCSKVTGLR